MYIQINDINITKGSNNMKVLIACEESQTITKEFRSLGIEAYSCDIKDCSGGFPEWHIKGDCLKEAYSGKYKMMIAHPPCTYLAISGNRHLYNKDGSRNEERYENQQKALQFVRALMDAPIDHICIENPLSVISSQIRKPDQIVQPYWFGDSAQKTTCLWLKNLPPLRPTNIVDKGEKRTWKCKKTGKIKQEPQWYYDAWVEGGSDTQKRRTLRSKTFIGMAKAIASQWQSPKYIQLSLFSEKL